MATEFDDVFARNGDATPTPAAREADGEPVRDEVGRFAPKTETPASTPEPQATPEPTDDARDANRHVPLKELLAERERFKKEKSLREEFERRATEHETRARTLEQMYQQAQRQPQQQPQQDQPQPPAPDPYADPEGFAQHQSQQQFLARRNDIANMSEAIARRTHGAEIVDKAIQAALQTGAAQHFYQRAADPYGELIDWYKHQTALQRIGPDPDAYEKSVETKLREKILAELKVGGTKPQAKFPGSLADATATGVGGQHLTEQAIADELFSTTRNRRVM